MIKEKEAHTHGHILRHTQGNKHAHALCVTHTHTNTNSHTDEQQKVSTDTHSGTVTDRGPFTAPHRHRQTTHT